MDTKPFSKKSKVEAVVIALLFIGTALMVPVGTLATSTQNTTLQDQGVPKNYYTAEGDGTFILDRSYFLLDPDPASTKAGDNDDLGHKKDGGPEFSRALPIYPGELVDDTPGRGVTGKLSSTDTADWFFFTACQGQSITVTLTPPAGFDFDLSIYNSLAAFVTSSNTTGSGVAESITFTTTASGRWYLMFNYMSGTGQGQYTVSIVFNTQNDANSGMDASDTMVGAMVLTQGYYHGFLCMGDPYDWYAFQVNTIGQGIHLFLDVKKYSYLADFDLQLYNPSGALVYEGNQYYDDEFNYPADATGLWNVRVDIFPGWVDVPQPTQWEYYCYGSGAYNLSLTLETSGDTIPAPIPQPDIIPIAKTYKVINDPDTNKDDYGYLAAVPACNYLEGGQRYLAPIIYTGDDTPTAYYDDDTSFGTVDDTTQYLVDDWEDYLALHAKTPVEYSIPADPIQAAADIATSEWTSSDTAVIAVDGSGFEDSVKTAVKRTATLRRQVVVEEVPGDSAKIVNIGGASGYPFFVGPKWCAVNVSMFGTGGATPTLGAIVPHFMGMAEDWWPSPYDGEGPKIDIYYPLVRMGIWVAGADIVSPLWTMKITKYAGDRYRFRVGDEDSVIKATLTTDDPSDLLVFLVDPEGYLRAPQMPAWNGPVNPIHEWNGFENPPVNPWRTWHPDDHTEYTAEVLHPQKGFWTAIVVPRNANGSDVKYSLNVDIQTVNDDRADAAVSAANAAVIASLNHYPLLYVNKDSVPAATETAFSQLSVNNVIFVERGEIGADVRGDLPTIDKDLTTMQEIIDEIKSYSASEQYITVTSLKTGDGFFAPAGMLAAYHGSPVLRIEDAAGNPAAVASRIHTWHRWDGDFYHGSRSPGHLPIADAPVDQNKLKLYFNLLKYLLQGVGELPPYGLDAKRYWTEEMYTAFHDYIVSLGLDEDGQEGYVVVAPREDIPIEFHSALMGNNSYAGHIPGDTPAYTNALVVRNVLYPALVFANPGKDTTITQMMNFPDGGSWRTNDGQYHTIYSSREVKNSFSSHMRYYEGHCLWDAHLEAMNNGASVMYYSGHGTGGSGISAQYYQTTHCNYPDQVWWDAWRGYAYDNWKTARDNGMVWYNAEPPMLYDIIHYKWVDQLLENLHSQAVFYMSCSTWDGDGPMVYLDHGAVIGYGNAQSGLCPEADLQDDEFFKDAMIYGVPVGVAFSRQVWLHYRDFTTSDPTSMYGTSSMQVSTIQAIYGDPSLIICSPDWQNPLPVDA
ncbi:MAG: PPC domain-containing protein [Candidatus Thermoplasmatota archaeon]|nr:PPC domain-containing protein [Candidatus Thermoplasmatota archaeon]